MKLKPNHFSGMMQKTEIIKKDGRKYTIRGNRMRYFFPDEWMAFYDNLSDRQKLTFNSLINTGARINEIRNVRPEDIDSERNSLVLRATKTRNKDGSPKLRIIPISAEFTKFLRKGIKHFNVQNSSNLPILSTPAANICLKKHLQTIGLQDYYMFSIHNIRKTLETWLLALRVDSMTITQHFGHSASIANKHYVSPDTFSFEEKNQMRMIIGDLYGK